MPDNYSTQTGAVQGDCYRITVLTNQLIRLEYNANGAFEDRPTQAVVARNFPPVSFQLWRSRRGIEIHTENLILFYNEQPFSAAGLQIENRSACAGIYCTWRYGDTPQDSLGGTARTLDGADGAVPLKDSILSRIEGYAVLDDSASWILTDDGWMAPRDGDGQDLYFFGYGYAYRRALGDYFHLCGATPLLPRYALGNWWSRYHPYSEDEYLALMDRFSEEKVPLSVSVIDMDWHLTRPHDGGKGWTGYTWNPALFPAPARFLEALHQRGLKTSLNLHPAEGVQPHEQAYPAMAQAMDRDAGHAQRIPFDPSDQRFMEAYFSVLHHPLEEQGVDFWWIDWQQGTMSWQRKLDPLWVLNHFHTADMKKRNLRPLILSRYAGPGSHRYPVGFSGDTVISWESFQFQPYFTLSASNAGFGWWSHDIGGHTLGSRDDTLQIRWLQFGVFSPIMRLHSSLSIFNRKEPWVYDAQAQQIMLRYLRLRHRLIPYLYSMNYRCHTQNEMLVRPMYYTYPEQPQAYDYKNQYYFGDGLLVFPITTPQIDALKMGSVAAWLPEGTYFDIFTGLRYTGDREVVFYRTLENIPVLAKAGAIIPMTEESEAMQNGALLPETLELYVYGGADGKHSLYEDDGETTAWQSGGHATTEFAFVWRDAGTTRFTLQTPPKQAFLPNQRNYAVSFIGVRENTAFAVKYGQLHKTKIPWEYDSKLHRFTLYLENVPADTLAEIVFSQTLELADNDVDSHCYAILNHAQIPYEMKDRVYRILTAGHAMDSLVQTLCASGISKQLYEALIEIIFA